MPSRVPKTKTPPHREVVGMSGGAYALLGMQLGDMLLNWERKSAPYRPGLTERCCPPTIPSSGLWICCKNGL